MKTRKSRVAKREGWEMRLDIPGETSPSLVALRKPAPPLKKFIGDLTDAGRALVGLAPRPGELRL
jgi:hypothetical protein